MGPKRKYSRLYSNNYLAYGFIESPVDKLMPMCLLCHKSFSNEAMKPSRLTAHLRAKHSEMKDKPMEFFQDIAEKFKKRTATSMFQRSTPENTDGLIASYRISELIAKSGCAHTIGEQLLIPCFQELISTMMHQDPAEVLKKLPLSNNTVKRRIDEMACDVGKHLISTLQTRVTLKTKNKSKLSSPSEKEEEQKCSVEETVDKREENIWEPAANLDYQSLISEFEENGKKEETQTETKSTVAEESMTKEPKKSVDEHERPRGFDRGLDGERIIGANNSSGELMFLMKWRETNEVDVVPAREANTRCPQVVIKFYEQRLTLVPSTKDEDSNHEAD